MNSRDWWARKLKQQRAEEPVEERPMPPVPGARKLAEPTPTYSQTVQRQQFAPSKEFPNLTEALAAGYTGKGGEAARTQHETCPNCGSTNYFTRGSSTPKCYDCNYNTRFGAQLGAK